MSFNTFPSNQLYGSHRYGNSYSGVSSVAEGAGSNIGSSNGGGKYRKRKYQEPSPEDNISFELGKNKRVTVRQFRNINLVDIREYYQDSATGEMKPGKKGISLTEEQYDELLHNQFKIDDALRQFGSKRKKAKMVAADQSDGESPAVREIELNKRKQADREEARREKKDRARENGKKKQIIHPPQIVKKTTDPMNPRLDDVPNPRLEVPRDPRLDDLAKPSVPAPKQEAKHHEDDDLNSSDEDFANALESEVRRQDEDISEEE